ncbi:MAG TPA: hypothetical protein VGX03_08215 [Candidatus Binatia bacterium]|nr:hypothetical protein [Candidatus Binatia bacterium]
MEKKALKDNRRRTFSGAWLLYCAVVSALAAFLLHRLSQTLAKEADIRRLPDYDQLVQFDPEREGGHLRPNLHLDVRGEFGAVRFITNSRGFRNTAECDYLPSPGVSRILLLGDSYVDGMRTDQEQTIGAVLQAALNAHGTNNRHMEVLVAGHNNPANAWYYYQEHGQKYHADVVILGLTVGNDFTSHNYRYGLLPEAGENGRIVLRKAGSQINMASPGSRVLLPEAAYRPASRWEGLEDKEVSVREWLAAHFRVFGYAIPPALMPWGNRRRHVYATDMFLSLGLFYRPGMPEIQEMYQDMDEMLTGMYRAVTANGTTFLVLLFPVRIQVAEKDWDLFARFYALDRGQFDLQKPNRHVLALCAQQGIECLDSLPALRQWYEAQGEPVYRARGDMHFNERGQQVVAESLAAYLLARHAHELGLSPE